MAAPRLLPASVLKSRYLHTDHSECETQCDATTEHAPLLNHKKASVWHTRGEGAGKLLELRRNSQFLEVAEGCE